MDLKIKEKLPLMINAFAWLLLKHRSKNLNKTRYEPDKVREATNLYKKNNDTYRQFIEEYVIEDKKSIIRLKELYETYKQWFKENNPNQTIPDKNTVEEYFLRLWGEFNTNNGKEWKGFRFVTDQMNNTNTNNNVNNNINSLIEQNEENSLNQMSVNNIMMT